MAEAAPHLINDNDVAILTADLAEKPSSWRGEDPAALWLDVPGELEKRVLVSPAALALARKSGRILVVEVGSEGITRQGWLTQID